MLKTDRKIEEYENDKFTFKVHDEYVDIFGDCIKDLTFLLESTPGYVEYVKP